MDAGFSDLGDTFRPELERKRWYWQFSAITAKAGGFDLAGCAHESWAAGGALSDQHDIRRRRTR
jgi:hypothetical protein